MSSTSSPSGANKKKKSVKDLQEEITNLYNNIRLFEKGTKFFSGKSCKSKITKSRTLSSQGRNSVVSQHTDVIDILDRYH